MAVYALPSYGRKIQSPLLLGYMVLIHSTTYLLLFPLPIMLLSPRFNNQKNLDCSRKIAVKSI